MRRVSAMGRRRGSRGSAPYALTDEAKADLDRHYTYLAERNPKAAQRLIESILAAIEQAYLFPEAAPQVAGADEPGNVPGTRKLIETEYRYVMYYRMMDGVLVILRVFHPAQRR